MGLCKKCDLCCRFGTDKTLCSNYTSKENPMENKDLEYDENKVQEGIDNEFLKYFDTEKPMENKVIFESEVEAYKFVVSILKTSDLLCDAPKLKELLLAIKEKGYIRKSAVEEAEEMYKLLSQDDVESMKLSVLSLVNKQHEAIQYLKARQK